MDQGNLQMAIGTAPPVRLDTSAPIDLSHDVRIVKAALLYSDHATLYSPTAYMLLSMLAIGEATPKQQLKFWKDITPVVAYDPETAEQLLAGFRKYEKILRKKHPNSNQLRFKEEFERHVSGGWDQMLEVVDSKFACAPGVQDLLRAAESGMLTIHVFRDTDRDKLVAEFAELVGRAVSEGSQYPLFDAQTSGLVRASIEEGAISASEVGIAKGRHTGLAAHLLNQLPLFDDASIDEMLDIRKELESPLVRFRSAMIRFSEQVRSAAWDEEFTPEADLVFHREVAPAILEIEEAVKSNRYLQGLLRKAASESLGVKGSSLAVVVSQMPALPDAISQALTLGGGFSASLATAKIVYDAYEEWRQRGQAIEQNQLFFYYDAKRRLSEVEARRGLTS